MSIELQIFVICLIYIIGFISGAIFGQDVGFRQGRGD